MQKIQILKSHILANMFVFFNFHNFTYPTNLFSTFLKHTLKSKKKKVQILAIVLQRIKHFFNSYDHANTFKSTNSLLQVVSEKTNIKI